MKRRGKLQQQIKSKTATLLHELCAHFHGANKVEHSKQHVSLLMLLLQRYKITVKIILMAIHFVPACMKSFFSISAIVISEIVIIQAASKVFKLGRKFCFCRFNSEKEILWGKNIQGQKVNATYTPCTQAVTRSPSFKHLSGFGPCSFLHKRKFLFTVAHSLPVILAVVQRSNDGNVSSILFSNAEFVNF